MKNENKRKNNKLYYLIKSIKNEINERTKTKIKTPTFALRE